MKRAIRFLAICGLLGWILSSFLYVEALPWDVWKWVVIPYGVLIMIATMFIMMLIQDKTTEKE